MVDAVAPSATSTSSIQVFCRVRPSKRPSGFFAQEDATQLAFRVPVGLERDVAHASGTAHTYRFSGIFPAASTQEQIFDSVARECVDSSLAGFNSTIFAYGQTGSGKTFTITGGAERYADRGIIPRALQRVFAAVKAATNAQFVVRVSYLEIYNEVAYDLLNTAHESKELEELP
jgi:kinesin family protein 6/9